MSNNKHKKPPIGLFPRKLWEEKRLFDVCLAITRYYQDAREIPIEWVEEYNQLIKNKE